MRSTLFVVGMVGLLGLSSAVAEDVSRVSAEGERPPDVRLNAARTLNDEYHPWSPPGSLAAWEQQAASIRRQVQVACGLWPMPEKTPLHPSAHGLIDRGDYTVEKVSFASRPGLYVTGSLYRPKTVSGRVPGVLCPHGHWADGRFHDAGEETAKKSLESGAEKFESGARSPLQARMVQLARMGCVVFHYDMIGYADSRPLVHREGFNDIEAELRLQNKLGLQTWNSLRALDFLESLPEVDPERIGVTGASGGGTQTFLLCAIDPRPAVAFPAVMVSTAMQGGCVCENASYLRLDINNVAIAAAFAPKPLAMSGADDWTIDIESKGLPELKQVYALYGHPERVESHCFSQFGHNYNQVSREMMFAWFNEHLGLGLESPIRQTDFQPLSREELSVYDSEHPLPADALDAAALRADLTREAEARFAALMPKTADELEEYRRVVGGGARVMLGPDVPEPESLATSITEQTTLSAEGFQLIKGYTGRKGHGQAIPFLVLLPRAFRGDVVLWIDGRGKSSLFDAEGGLAPWAGKLLENGRAVVSGDVLLTGELLAGADKPQREVNAVFPGFTFGYNRPLLTERVQDILTLVAAAKAHPAVQRVHLLAGGGAGPWGLLAAAIAGDELSSATVDCQGFSFARIVDVNDPMLLPGALKYGDLPGLAALAAPTKLTIYGVPANSAGPVDLAVTRKVYELSGGTIETHDGPLMFDELDRVVDRFIAR